MEEGTSSTEKTSRILEDSVKYTQDVFKAVIAATRCAKALPKLGDNYELYNSYPLFAQLMEAEGDRILQLISKLCNHAGAKTHLMDNTLLMEERMDRLSEVNDFLLERIGNLLDEAAGLRRPEELVVVGPDMKAPLARTIATSWNRGLQNRRSTAQDGESSKGNRESASESTASNAETGQLLQKRPLRLLGSSNVARPQTQFSDQIDNSNKPFVPKLRFKHNAKERDQRGKIRIVDDDKQEGTTAMETDMETPAHPYKYELDHFEPEPWQLEYPNQSTDVKPVEDTPLIYVSTEAQLESLCRTLKSVQEFAVDLEHHSYRTFQGLTCLMQISTRTHDYIVDTLALWRHMHILNDPFTDPAIMKVFHGASMDIIWLQRDFGIYVVNMFDTGQAVRQLNFPRLSLAYLVQRYCGEELEKQYQMADWRIRPLPDELITYARKDTHYLLICCDRLRRELLDQGNEQKNLLKAVFMSSRDLCLQVYQKPLFNPDDYLTLLAKSRKRFNTRQLYALKHLYAWRDNLARTEDESYPYVLPDHMLLQIAEVLPREMQGIWACCSPVPPLVRQDSHSLHRVILHARGLSLESNESRLLQADREATQRSQHGATVEASSSIDVRSSMLKHHDFSHTPLDEEIAPLSHRLTAVPKSITIKEPLLSFFDYSLYAGNDGEPPSKKRKTVKVQSLEEAKKTWSDMLTPYDQYLLTMAAAEAEKNVQEKQADENQKQAPRKRKMHSHLDPVVEKSKPSLDEQALEEPSTSTLQQENDEVGERPRKKRKVTATTEDAQLDEILPAKKLRKRKRKPKPDVSLMQSYDYAAADTTMFSKGASAQKANVFEPHKEFMNKRDKKKKKAQMKKGMTSTGGGGWKKKSAAAFASMGPGGGGGTGKGKKGGKR